MEDELDSHKLDHNFDHVLDDDFRQYVVVLSSLLNDLLDLICDDGTLAVVGRQSIHHRSHQKQSKQSELKETTPKRI